ncbi:recombinase family protein [Bacillus wiedmannii]|uniref:recombinase family protein n=1 Tax=Bacillus wiedmannii TaxID=1890302 RepID=UPI00211D4E35|nr:recombinase family protein [Bacillus wiedmannii]
MVSFGRPYSLKKASSLKRKACFFLIPPFRGDGQKHPWKDITKNIKAHIVITDMPLLDTTKYKDNLGNLITDLVLQILSWLAEEERTKIKTRQREGIDLAKKQGKHLGRPKAEITPAFITAYDIWKTGAITAVEAIEKANVPKTTFYRLVQKYEAQLAK